MHLNYILKLDLLPATQDVLGLSYHVNKKKTPKDLPLNDNIKVVS